MHILLWRSGEWLACPHRTEDHTVRSSEQEPPQQGTCSPMSRNRTAELEWRGWGTEGSEQDCTRWGGAGRHRVAPLGDESSSEKEREGARAETTMKEELTESGGERETGSKSCVWITTKGSAVSKQERGTALAEWREKLNTYLVKCVSRENQGEMTQFAVTVELAPRGKIRVREISNKEMKGEWWSPDYRPPHDSQQNEKWLRDMGNTCILNRDKMEELLTMP